MTASPVDAGGGVVEWTRRSGEAGERMRPHSASLSQRPPHPLPRPDVDLSNYLRPVPDAAALSETYNQLQEKSKALIESTSSVFAKTAVYHQAVDVLRKFRLLIVRGPPVSGKTNLGHALLRHAARHSGHAPLVVERRVEWERHVATGRKKRAVLLDCLLGQVKVDEGALAEWNSIMSGIGQFVEDQKRCLVVVAMPTHVLNHLDIINNDGKPFFCDLDDTLTRLHDVVLNLGDVTLTPEDKKGTLKRHLTACKLKQSDKELHDVISHDASGPAFGWCCQTYAKALSHQPAFSGEQIFHEPSLAYIQFFRSALADPECWKGMLPVLALIANGSSHLLNDAGDRSRIDSKLIEMGFKRALDVPANSFTLWCHVLNDSLLKDRDGLKVFTETVGVKVFTEADGVKVFKTRALSNGFGLALFDSGLGEIMVHTCDLRFLVDHLSVQWPLALVDSTAASSLQQHTSLPLPGSEASAIIVINATSNLYRSLMMRLYNEIRHGNIVQAIQHPVFHENKFLQAFAAFIRPPGDHLRCMAFLTARDHTYQLPVLYWSAWSPAEHLTRWCLALHDELINRVDGEILKKIFFVCALFGEKITVRRVAAIFSRLCSRSDIIDSELSPVTLPVPLVKDIMTEEMKARCSRALAAPAFRLCGARPAAGEPVDPGRGQTTPRTRFSAARSGAGHPPAGRGATVDIPAQLLDDATFRSLQRIYGEEDFLGGPVSPWGHDPAGHGHDPSTAVPVSCTSRLAVGPSWRANPLETAGQDGDDGALGAEDGRDTQRPCSQDRLGYMLPVPSPSLAERQLQRDRGENPSRQNTPEDIPSTAKRDGDGPSRRCGVSNDLASAGPAAANSGRQDSSNSSDYITLLPYVPEMTSPPHAELGPVLPDSIVQLRVDNANGRLVVKPMCKRWYTVFCLLSMMDVNEVNFAGYPLWAAVINYNEHQVLQFLVDNGVRLDSVTPTGNTPLTKAIQMNNVPLAKYLMEEGEKRMASNSATHGKEGDTRSRHPPPRSPGDDDTRRHHEHPASGKPVAARDLSWMFGTGDFSLRPLLVHVVKKGHFEMLLALLHHGANPTGVCGQGRTLLDHARTAPNNQKIVDLLTRYDEEAAKRGHVHHGLHASS